MHCEIFGKRRSGVRTRALPLGGDARTQPTAPTRVRFSKGAALERAFGLLKGEFVSLCHPERSGGYAAAQSKDLYKNKDGIRIEIPRRARDDGARLPFCVILSGAVGFLPVILSGVARRAAESKDLYSNFVDIFIEIPLCARDDRGRGCLFVSF